MTELTRDSPSVTKDRTGEHALTPSLRASVRDGMAHAAMLGVGETYVSVFGIFLQATTVQIGLLATLPQFIGAIWQTVAVFFLRFFRSRRAPIVLSACVNAAVWPLLAAVPFVFGPGETGATVLIGLMIIYHAAGNFGAPLWNSLIGDLVPPSSRGRFFGLRNKLTGGCTFLAVIVGGQVLEWGRASSREAIGFAVIFLIACVCRLISAWWLARYDDPPFEVRPAEEFSFLQFIRRMPRSNFARFVLFFATINFSVALSGPYFAVYMLRDLKFTYLEFTAVSAALTVTQLLCMQYWGQLTDRFGNKKILNICGLGVAVVPVLWLCSTEVWFIMLIQVYGGLVWAGFNLAAANFLFDAVTPPKRARCAAYQALVNGALVMLGSVIGGVIAAVLPDSIPLGLGTWEPASPLVFLFLLSGVLRLLIAVVLLPKFREVREVEAIGHTDLIFHITQLRPITGATFGVLSGLLRRGRRREQPPSAAPEPGDDPG